MEVINTRWIVTRWHGEECDILSSMSIGNGGWHMDTEWIDMDDADDYPAAFFTSSENDARLVAILVGGNAVKVPCGLVGVRRITI